MSDTVCVGHVYQAGFLLNMGHFYRHAVAVPANSGAVSCNYALEASWDNKAMCYDDEK